MRIIVVDDERPARSELIYLIRECSPSSEIIEAENSEKMMELLKTDTFDACFVDINLGGINGTTLASMIKNELPLAQIVFATAYQEYAVKAFELGAVDYLLKPFDLERVRKTMERITEKSAGQVRVGQETINKIMIYSGKSFQVLDMDQIIFIETEKRYCKIHTAKEEFVQNESLNYYENRLRNNGFFRIHKSYLINLKYVMEMLPTYNNGYSVKLKYVETETLPIGRSQIKEFRQIFER